MSQNKLKYNPDFLDTILFTDESNFIEIYTSINKQIAFGPRTAMEVQQKFMIQQNNYQKWSRFELASPRSLKPVISFWWKYYGGNISRPTCQVDSFLNWKGKGSSLPRYFNKMALGHILPDVRKTLGGNLVKRSWLTKAFASTGLHFTCSASR